MIQKTLPHNDQKPIDKFNTLFNQFIPVFTAVLGYDFFFTILSVSRETKRTLNVRKKF